MKKHVQILLIALMMTSFCWGQSNCNFPVPPGTNLQNAPLLGGCFLDGYCSDLYTIPNNIPGNFPNFCFAGTIENVQFIYFVPVTPQLTLFFSQSDCINNQGIQAAIYALDDCKQPTFPVSCQEAPLFPASFPLSAFGLVPHEVYLLVVDGFAGDLCAWEVSLLDGEIKDCPSPNDPENYDLGVDVNGPTVTNAGSTCLYTVNVTIDPTSTLVDTSCGYDMFSCCGSGGGCVFDPNDFEIEWTIQGAGFIVGYPDPFSVEVIWSEPGGTICASVTWDCIDPIVECLDVEALDPNYPPYQPTDYCLNAPLLCEDYLFSYQANTANYYPDTGGNLGSTYSCPIENNAWFQFYTCSNSVSFEVSTAGCTQGNGIEFSIFKVDSCTLFTPLLNCSLVSDGMTDTFTVSNLSPEDFYYVMVDGISGDSCDYQIKALNGVADGGTMTLSGTPGSITGPLDVCEGDTAFYYYTPPTCDIDLSGCFLPASDCDSNTIVHEVHMAWIFPAQISAIGDSINVNPIMVTFADTGAQVPISVVHEINPGDTANPVFDTITFWLCNYPANFGCSPEVFGLCDMSEPEIHVNINPREIIEETYLLCVGESINLCGQTITTNQTVTCTDSCKTFIYDVQFEDPLLVNMGIVEICEWDCFDFFGTMLCDEGTFQTTQPGNGPCDDIYEVTIVKLPSFPIFVTDVTEICDMPGLNYTVSFFINGIPPFLVNGEMIFDNFYTSAPIPNGDPYSFDILDIFFCNNPTTISGSFDCPTICPTDAGTFITAPINVCPDIPASAAHNGDEVLDSGDVLSFVLHTGNNPLTGSILAQNSTGIFNFNPGSMSYGVAYQISALAGNNIGNGVDPFDPCIDIAAGPTVTFYPEVDAIIQGENLLDCNTPSTLLEVIPIGGSGNFSFDWGGIPSNTLFVSNSGAYTCTVTDNLTGCFEIASMDVLADFQAPIAMPMVDGVITCNIPSVTLEAQLSDPNDLVYWVLPDGSTNETNTFVSSIDGVYELTVTGANGCTASNTITVLANDNPPSISTSVDGVLTCADPEVLLSAQVDPTSTVIWTTPNGDQFPGIQLPTNIPGNYDVEVVGNNGCVANSTIEVLSDQELPSVNISNSGVLDCNNPVVNLLANPNLPNMEISWLSPGGITVLGPAFSATEPGNYTLTLQASNGCVATQQYILDGNIDAPQLSVDISGQITCAQSSVNLQVGSNMPNTLFTWTTPSGQNLSGMNLSASEPGAYTVQGLAQNGCSSSETVMVTANLNQPIVTIPAPTPLTCNNPTSSVSASSNLAGCTFVWELPSGTNENGSTITGATPGIYVVTVTALNGCSTVESTLLESQMDNPDLMVQGIEAITCATPIVTLSAGSSVSGATWIWTLPAGSQIPSNSIDVTTPGTYVVEVMAANGCFSTQSVEIEENIAIPVVDVSAMGILNCEVQAIPLVADADVPVLIEWESPAGLIFSGTTISATESGSYLWTATASNGCISSGTALVQADLEEPVVSFDGALLLNCFMPSTTLTGTSSLSDGVFSWELPSGELVQEATILVNQAGDYIFSHTAPNGCEESIVASVVADFDSPSIDVSVSGEITCDQTIVVGAATSSMNNTMFIWETPDGTLIPGDTISIDQAGIFTIFATGPNGCLAEDQMEVMANNLPPVISISSNQVITCTQPEINLQAQVVPAGSQINWHFPDGNIVAGNNITTGIGGLYELEAIGLNGCVGIQDLEVLQDTLPPSAQVVAEDALSCSVDQVTLYAESDTNIVTYQWFGPGILATGLPSVEAEISGTYTCIVTGENGCTTSASTFVEQYPDFEGVHIQTSMPGCFGDKDGSISLDAVEGGTGPFQIELNGQALVPDVFPIPASSGNYYFQIMDAEGCSWDTTFQIDEPEAFNITLGEDLLVSAGEELTLSPSSESTIDFIKWKVNEEYEQVNSTSLTLSPLATTVVFIDAWDDKGCLATDELIIRVEHKEPVFIPSAFSPNGDGKNDYFTLFSNSMVTEIEYMRIYNRWGEKVFERRNLLPNEPEMGWDGRFRNKTLNNAVFVYQFQVRLQNGTQKIYSGDVTLTR